MLHEAEEDDPHSRQYAHVHHSEARGHKAEVDELRRDVEHHLPLVESKASVICEPQTSRHLFERCLHSESELRQVSGKRWVHHKCLGTPYS